MNLDRLKAARDYTGNEWGTLQERDVRMALAPLIAVAEAAVELVTPCEFERGFCIAHGTVRLPCPVADLATALTFLDPTYKAG